MSTALVFTALSGTLFVACGSDDDEDARASRESGRSTTTTEPTTTSTTAPSTTTTAPTTTTTAPPTTTTTAPAPPPPADPLADGMLRPGENGEAVRNLQQRLVDLGYWLGAPDGGYGELTRQAVLAFQKAEGLGRDGVAGPDTRARLDVAGRPQPRGSNGVEIDLARQLLFVVQNGQVVWAFNTSTGTSSTPTPPGQFTVSREIDGYRRSDLGLLYRPRYFNGGIAIHGSNSIPAYPASHGCTRLSNPAMDFLWSSGFATIGSSVWVY